MIAIADLGDTCDRHWALALGWFEILGQWVLDEPDPARQRFWSAAGHRHAWHAELWAGRRPRIPPERVPVAPPPALPTIEGDRCAAYRAALASWRAELAAVRADLDPELDPSTERVVALVDADLADLAAVIASLAA